MPVFRNRRPARDEHGSQPTAIVPDSIARNTITSLFSHVFTAGLTAVLTLFLVRALEPDAYGLFALSTSISVIVLVAADFGISASTSRFAAERRDRRDAVGELYVDALKLKVVATGTVCLLLGVLAGVIADAYGQPGLAWPLRVIALATLGQSIFLMGLFTALGQSMMRVKVGGFEAIVEVSASIALVLLGGGAVGAAFGRAIGYVAGALLAIVLTLQLLGWPRLRPSRPPRRETVRRVGRYASALLVVDTAFVVGGNANILLLGAYLGPVASGLFQAPIRLIVLFQHLGLSVASGIAPRMARRPGHEPEVGALSRGLRLLIFYECALLAPVILWGQPLIDLLLGDGFERSGEIFSAMAPYVLFSGVAPLLSLSINYYGGARKRIPIALITLALTVATATTLIPRYGLVGAAIATDISFGFYTLAHFYLCWRLLGLPLAPIARSLAGGLTAAVVMGLVISRFGTDELTLLELVGGGLVGLVAYVAMLAVTRQITANDVQVVRKKLQRRRGNVTPAPAATAVPAPPAGAAPADDPDLNS